jgi:Glutaredoxin-like domain (DUF836)
MDRKETTARRSLNCNRSVVLYSKRDCHLCEEAAAILTRLEAEVSLVWRTVDITSDQLLFDQFKYRIPVIQIENGPTLDWPTTVERVRRAVLTR